MTPERPDPAVPTATYRLQLQPEFPFTAAAAAVPYLASLGVSHLHLSPSSSPSPAPRTATTSSTTRVRDELGGEDGLRALARTAREHGLGLVVDIVPNHMAMSPRHNHALWEVLREGPKSPYARWFDIDWEAQGGQVLLPVLGGPVGGELEHMAVDGDVLRYYDHVFPLREGTAELPLPRLLDAQWYRPVWWRLARTELNYRRFFSISELIGVRVEDPEVFDATHAKMLQLLREGVVDGLRVDHPDGLADPDDYLARLHEATGGRWTVVEKILADGEHLPASWPVAGTTGYDALRQVDGLFTDPAGVGELLGQYRRFAAPQTDRGGQWEATVRRAAYKVLTHELVSEMDRLTRVVVRLCATSPSPRCATVPPGRCGPRCWSCWSAWRCTGPTPPGTPPPSSPRRRRPRPDRRSSSRRRPVPSTSYGSCCWGLRGRARTGRVPDAVRADRVRAAGQVRRGHGVLPVCAASVGDRGGREPGQPRGVPGGLPRVLRARAARLARHGHGAVDPRHQAQRRRTGRAGRAHRGAGAVGGRAGRGDPHRRGRAGRPTGVGCLADGVRTRPRGRGARPGGPAEACARGGPVHELDGQEPPYEEAVAAFVAAGPCGAPGERVAAFRTALEAHVRANMLSATLVHLTMPGVPDLYQGTETEYRALVDPDNRRPVPFPAPHPGDKGALTVAALRLRARRPEVFGDAATYTPLTAEGPAAAHCVAFARSGSAVTAVTRLSSRLAEAGGWRDTVLPLPPGRWADVLAPEREFTGRARVADVLASSPAVLLERVGESN